MATQNIRMRKRNGTSWDVLYPLTIASNVAMINGQTVQHEIDNIFTKTATPTANGALSSSDKAKLNSIEDGANKYIHPNDPSVRHATDTQIAVWNDKYTRLEIDNKFNELNIGLDWKESVNTFTDLATAYPSPVDGWTVNVKDTDTTYRYTGTTWISISANSIPLASQTIDGKMSRLDKKALDQAVIDVANIKADMTSLSQGVTGDFSSITQKITDLKNENVTITGNITALQNGKANANHNHDSVYSKLGHVHDYAATTHTHSDYLSISGGTLLGNLGIKSIASTIELYNSDGTYSSRFRNNATAGLIVSVNNKSIYLRPGGDSVSTGEVVISSTGMTVDGKSVSLVGHGNHIPASETDISQPRFLRNDNTWQRLTANLIGAADSSHTHDTVYQKFDYTGSTEYPRLVPVKSNWIRFGDANGGGVLPYVNNVSNLGTSSWRFKEIHCTTLFENGTALSSKYMPLSGGAINGRITGFYNTGTTLDGTLYQKLGFEARSDDGGPAGIGFHRIGKSAIGLYTMGNEAKNLLRVRSSSNGDYDVYHSGNKPTPAEIGAISTADYEVGSAGILKNISGQNIRSINKSGRYMGQTCANAPSTGWWFFDIEVHNTSWKNIVAKDFNSNTVYACTQSNGVWTGWVKVYTTDFKPTPADIGASPTIHTHNYLPASGGTISGGLTVQGSLQVGGIGVVSSGSSSDGSVKWVRFYDGTQICWGEHVHSSGDLDMTNMANGASGATYGGINKDIYFPVTFTTKPSVSVTVATNGYTNGQATGVTTTLFLARAWGNYPIVVSHLYINWTAIGKWK